MLGFMEKEVLSSKSPLFGRRTGQLHMKSFDYHTSLRLLDGFSDEEILLLSSMLRRLYSNAELALGHPEHLTERCPASEQAAPAASRKETGT